MRKAHISFGDKGIDWYSSLDIVLEVDYYAVDKISQPYSDQI